MPFFKGLLKEFPSMGAASKKLGILYGRLQKLVETGQVSLDGIYYKLLS